MKPFRILFVISFLLASPTAHSMDIFSAWLKKPQAQTEYATNQLKKMLIDPYKPLPSDFDQKVKELIVQGADPNIGDEFNNPLILAAEYNRADLARFLLTHGADPNYLPRAIAVLPGTGAAVGSGSALNTAIAKNNTEIIEILLEHGADPNKKDALLQWTPLMFAITNGTPETVRTILTTKSKIPLDLSVTDSQGHTAFYFVTSRLNNHVTQGQLDEAREIEKIVHEFRKQRLP